MDENKTFYFVSRKLNWLERKLGVDLEIDYITITPKNYLGVTAGYYHCEKSGKSTIYIPVTECEQQLEQLIWHELGHAYYRIIKIPKYVLRLFHGEESSGGIGYLLKSWLASYGKRPIGFCSKYSTVDPEEEFVETFSFILFNRSRSRYFSFDSERIDLKEDTVLQRKVRFLRKYLKLDTF